MSTRISIRVRLSFTLLFASLMFAPAAVAAKPSKTSAPVAHVFKVGRTVFAGKSKTICVIEGKWLDGDEFRYEAWDKCSALNLTRGTQAQFVSVRPRGTDKRFSGQDIPAGAEVFEISNEYSSVLVFRDQYGIQREIMTRD